MEAVINFLTGIITNVISSTGYLGVAFLMAVASAAIPLPSEIVMTFAGYLASEGRFTLFWLSIIGGLGSAVGSAITYWAGRYGGRPLIERYGKYILISKHDLDIADRFFARFGLLSTFIGRMLPVVRAFISVPAGIAKVRFWPFLIYSFMGSVIWSFLLAYFGYKLGPAWSQLREGAHWVDYVIIAVILAIIAWWAWRHLKNRKAHGV